MLKSPLVVAVIVSDASLRSLLCDIIRAAGDLALKAASFADGTTMLAEYPWDIAIIGSGMPDGDGLELCREVSAKVREDAGHRHILFVSSPELPDAIILGLSAGADECITTTIDPPELRARLQAIRRSVLMQKTLLGRLATLEQLSVIDGLTHVFNHRFFQSETRRVFDVAVRHDRPLSLAMIDLDNFKAVNDTCGHAIGDVVLREVSTGIAQTLRSSDVLARYGGEEFAVLLVETTPAEAALVAERVRAAVERLRISSEKGELRITLSIGVAGLPSVGLETPTRFIEAADRALYAAKRDGRNCVRVHGITSPSPDERYGLPGRVARS